MASSTAKISAQVSPKATIPMRPSSAVRTKTPTMTASLTAQDQCVKVSAGGHPDPAKPVARCPDRDGDSVVDAEDACPTKPGAPDPDPEEKRLPGPGRNQARPNRHHALGVLCQRRGGDPEEQLPVLQAVANVLSRSRRSPSCAWKVIPMTEETLPTTWTSRSVAQRASCSG
jgi:hypothetical protein